MKLLKTLAMSAILGSAAVSAASAQTIVETWSSTAAWISANQPDFVPSGTPSVPGGGILYTDQAIDGGTNNSGSNTGAIWSSAVTAGQGIYGDYYYTFMSQPAVSLSATNVLENVETITFTLVSNAALLDTSVSLSYDGAQEADLFSQTFIGVDPNFGQNMYQYVWTWDVSALAQEDSFSLGWTTPSMHSAYISATLTQAVPEPTAAALGVLGVIVMLGRRRMRAVSRA